MVEHWPKNTAHDKFTADLSKTKTFLHFSINVLSAVRQHAHRQGTDWTRGMLRECCTVLQQLWVR